MRVSLRSESRVLFNPFLPFLCISKIDAYTPMYIKGWGHNGSEYGMAFMKSFIHLLFFLTGFSVISFLPKAFIFHH